MRVSAVPVISLVWRFSTSSTDAAVSMSNVARDNRGVDTWTCPSYPAVNGNLCNTIVRVHYLFNVQVSLQ